MAGKIKFLAVLVAGIMMASIFPADVKASSSIAEPIDEPVDGEAGAVKPSGPMPYAPSNPSPKKWSNWCKHKSDFIMGWRRF